MNSNLSIPKITEIMVEFVKRDNINAPTKMKYVKSTI